MKTVSTRRLRKALSALGLRPAAKGNGTGRDVWVDGTGRTCHPVLRHREVAWAVIYSLSLELEAKGICTRRDLATEVRG